MRERASTPEELELANNLLEAHIRRYSDARVEIERVTQIGLTNPKQLLTLLIDGCDVDAYEIYFSLQVFIT